MSRDEPTGTGTRFRGYRVVSVLRLAGIALLVVGFAGWVLDDGGEVTLESPFTVAFGAGVVCALASVYLGIFLSNRD